MRRGIAESGRWQVRTGHPSALLTDGWEWLAVVLAVRRSSVCSHGYITHFVATLRARANEGEASFTTLQMKPVCWDACRCLTSAHGSFPSPCQSWAAEAHPPSNGLRLLSPPQRCSSPEGLGSAARRRNVRPPPAWSSDATGSSLSEEASYCELSRHGAAPQLQQHAANSQRSSTQSAAQQNSAALREIVQEDSSMPRSQQAARRRPVLLRLSARHMRQSKGSGLRNSATACVRLLTARAAQASHARRTARLLRLSLGIRSRGNRPQQPPSTLKPGRAAHGRAGAREEEGHAPPGWHLHSLRLLRVPRPRASMRASSRGRTLARAYGRVGPRAQASSSEHWRRLQRRGAVSDCRTAQMPLPAQHVLRPPAVTHGPWRDDHDRYAAHVTPTLCLTMRMSFAWKNSAVHVMLLRVLSCAINHRSTTLSMSACCCRAAAVGGARHGWRQAGGSGAAPLRRSWPQQAKQRAPGSGAWPSHVNMVDAEQQTVRHAQQQAELDPAAAKNGAIRSSGRNGRSRAVSDGGQTSQHDGGTMQQVSEQRSKLDDSSDAVPLRPPAETRAATGPCDPTLRLPQGASARPGAERGSDGPHRPPETRGDVAQEQLATPDAAPAIASLIAQLAAAFRTAGPAGPAGDATEAPQLPDPFRRTDRHCVRFLTVAPLPSARREEPSAADLSPRRDTGVSSTAHARLQPQVDVEPNAAAAAMHGADTAAGLRAQSPLLPAARSRSEHAQDTAERRQADSSHEAAADQPDTGTRPHVDLVQHHDTPATSAADHVERHSPARPEHVAASKPSAAAEDGRDAAAPLAVPMRWGWHGISDDQT